MSLRKVYKVKFFDVFDICRWCGYSTQEYNFVGGILECQKEILKKMDWSRAKTDSLKFRFTNEMGGNGSYRNVKLGDKCINKVERFKCLGSVMLENGRILEDVTRRIKCD